MSSVLERFERLPIRWRLAGTSALLTFVILLVFALVIGQLTASRVRSDFGNETKAAVADLTDRLSITVRGQSTLIQPDLNLYAAPNHAVIRIMRQFNGAYIGGTKDAPNLGPPVQGTTFIDGYRVEERGVLLQGPNPFNPENPQQLAVWVQYGRKVSDLEATVRRIRLFLALGVFGGTLLALAAGLMLARRAMKPIADLTATAREIARTGDPDRSVPRPAAEDEVAELATTLEDMLRALEHSRQEMEAMLERQRQFVADASHELRTPLTSVLANLELLADVLDGDAGEAASSALRSSQRMRRLVADLLLLARADARRETPHEPTDLSKVLVEVAGEIGPVSADHELSIEADGDGEAVVDGARDELHRMALNLIENAIRHTPPGTRIRAATDGHGQEVVLTIEDDGPGIPPELRGRIFERFVRGEGDRGGSFGLGLSIVKAVADSHGGSVALEQPESGQGARFVVRLPRARETAPLATAQPAAAP
jgi:signal transduction histidine kinase